MAEHWPWSWEHPIIRGVGTRAPPTYPFPPNLGPIRRSKAMPTTTNNETTENAEATQAKAKNTNKRYFDIEAAAKHLARVAPEKAIDQKLEAAKVVASPDSSAAEKAVHLLRGVTTQGAYAAVLINFTHGEGRTIDGETVTQALKDAFPNANIAERHGPHYLCHARTAIRTLAKDPEAENTSIKCMKGLRRDLPPLPTARRKAKSKDEKDVPVSQSEPLTVELLLKENDEETLRSMADGLDIRANKNWKIETVARKIVEAMEAAADDAGATDDGEEEAAA